MAAFNVNFPGNKKVDIQFGSHTLKTDQDKESGGNGTAPEPFALFLAGLASCAGYYAKTFCDARKLDTQGMKLELDPFFKEGQKTMEKVVITLHVPQSFPEKYIKAVIKSMGSCAVKNQMHPDIPFENQVVYLSE